jgi:hypothetical protein
MVSRKLSLKESSDTWTRGYFTEQLVVVEYPILRAFPLVSRGGAIRNHFVAAGLESTL